MKIIPTDIYRDTNTIAGEPSVSIQYETQYILENLVNDPFMRAIAKVEQETNEDLAHLKIAYYESKVELLKELVKQATSELEEICEGSIEGHPLEDKILELVEIEKTKQL